MNQKVRQLGKRKIDSLARKHPRKLHTSEYTNSCLKKMTLYSNEDTIDYNQKCFPLHLGNEQYKQFPQKRKNLKKEKGRRKEKKRECEREGKGKGKGKGEERREREEERVRTGRKRRRKRRRNKRKRKKEGKIGENGKSDTESSSLSTPPSADAFPSTTSSLDGARE